MEQASPEEKEAFDLFYERAKKALPELAVNRVSRVPELDALMISIDLPKSVRPTDAIVYTIQDLTQDISISSGIQLTTLLTQSASGTSLDIGLDSIKWYDHRRKGEEELSRREFTQALHQFRTALSLAKKGFGECHKNTATCLKSMAMVYLEQNLWSDALPYLEKALASERSIYGKTNSTIANTLHTTADAYVEAHKYEQARDLLIEELEIWRRLNDDTGLYEAEYQLGKAEQALKLDSATSHLQNALSLKERELQQWLGTTSTTLEQLGLIEADAIEAPHLLAATTLAACAELEALLQTPESEQHKAIAQRVFNMFREKTFEQSQNKNPE